MWLQQLPTPPASPSSDAGGKNSREATLAHTKSPDPPSSQTQIPLHTHQIRSALPLVQYSDDEPDEEEETRPATDVAEKSRLVLPSHAGKVTIPDAPTPTKGRDSNCPNLLKSTLPTTVLHIEDDSVEDFLPPPKEILPQAGAEMTFIPDINDEPMSDKEEEPLYRRKRRIENNKPMEGDLDNIQRTGETREERLQVAIPENTEGPTDHGQTNEENEAVQRNRQETRKKRKGKEVTAPSPKRRRPAHRSIVITDEQLSAPPLERNERSDSEEETLRWPRSSHGHRRRSATTPVIDCSKKTVILTADLLQRMLEFENQKLNDDILSRVTPTKQLKAGRKLHQPTLATLQVEESFTQYITGIGFEWLLEIEDTFVPTNLAKEFFTSFRFTGTTNLETKSISFRVFGQNQKMNLNEFSIRMGLYTEAQVASGEWFGRDIGLPQRRMDFDQLAVWQSLCGGQAPEFKASDSRGTYIADPSLRLAQVYLACNLLGQANTFAIITLAELYFMWCMKEQRKVHLGFWLAYSINHVASRPSRHLNVCHLLGAYLKRNWTIVVHNDVGRPERCPKPELFNLNFFVRIQVLERLPNGNFCFYTKARQEEQSEQQESRREDRRRTIDRPTSPRPQRRRIEMEQTTEPEEGARTNRWEQRMEKIWTQLLANSDAQLTTQANILTAIHQQTLAMQTQPPSSSSFQHPSSSRPPPTSSGQVPRKP